jgi:SAM-dependent methyltransferase
MLPEGGTGIEIGVGTGRFAAPLGIKVGVEPAQAMAVIAHRERGIEVVAGVAEALPFQAGQFDYALLVTTVCFLDDVAASCREVYRVLSPGGHTVVGLLDRDGPLGTTYQEYKNENAFYSEATFYSVDEVVSYLSEAGFGRFTFAQTIFRPLDTINASEPVKRGCGQGSFVVIRATKQGPWEHGA